MKLKINMFILIVILFSINVFSQYSIFGKIVNQDQKPVAYAILLLNDKEYQADVQGNYAIKDLLEGTYKIEINEQGFKPIVQTLEITKSQKIDFILIHDHSFTLDQVELISHKHDFTTANSEHVGEEYIQENYGGSLAKSLENMAGVNASGIGASTSKPIIRGLGFNRLVVTENGIKQEGQQWGADHGLEIDALNIEDVEVVKGPGVLEYGNEAIAGVIRVKNSQLPPKNSNKTNLSLLYQSVNDNYLASFNHVHRKNNFFYKIKGTYSDYGDYKTTASEFRYLDRWMPIYNKSLKNTAGKDLNAAIQVGYVNDNFRSILSISNTNQKVGFFPGAHGIPSSSSLIPDGNTRNIEFPYQQVNHFKVISENELKVNKRNLIKINLAYQNNLRQEFSAFHTHYGNIKRPIKNPDLEMQFSLSTYDAQFKYEYTLNKNFKTIVGVQSQIQNNNIDGYSYLLPKYDRNIYSGFILEEFQYNKVWKITGGIRFDYADFKSQGYFDNNIYDYLINNNYSDLIAEYYAQRSKSIKRSFANWNAMLGITYQPNNFWDFNLNVGSNFRLPTAVELASNGIHHGSFRHERGDADLNSEKGFAIDVKSTYHHNGLDISLSPYLYYFSNYIFLKPSGEFSILPDGGQIYQYTQSKALLMGFEAMIQKKFTKKLEALLIYEFINNRQLSENNKLSYYLPFTPANNVFSKITYKLENPFNFLSSLEFNINGKYSFKQDKIALNEEETQAFFLLGAGVKSNILINKFKASLIIQGSNLLNKKYYNHTSFYRAINLPEQARNIQIILNIPFG